MHEDPRTQARNMFPATLMKFLKDVPLAGTPQELQSGAASHKLFGSICSKTQMDNLSGAGSVDGYCLM